MELPPHELSPTSGLETKILQALWCSKKKRKKERKKEKKEQYNIKNKKQNKIRNIKNILGKIKL